MIGILVELLISWLLLWLYDRKNLSVLGFGLSKKRCYQFCLGLFISALCCTAYFLATIQLSDSTLTFNETFHGKQVLQGSWWTLKSVLFEELIFRGALLYIAIQMLGIRPACIVSAVAFGIYHWFSYGIFGQPVQMIYIFLLTGVTGLMFAYAFARTKSLYLPIGLHLGWNLVTIVVFSQGPLGNQLFDISTGKSLSTTISLVLFLYQVAVLPLIVFWYLGKAERR